MNKALKACKTLPILVLAIILATCSSNPNSQEPGLDGDSGGLDGLDPNSGNNGGEPGSPSAGPVAYYGKLKASGSNIVGSKTGTAAVQVRGVSLGWSNTGWESASFFNAATVNAMVDDWKAEIIRVPIGYAEDGGYKSDASNKTRAKAAIDAAIKKGVYVIIDWHSHNASSETAAATEFFSEMAQTYGSYDNVIFEVFNEPLNISWQTIKTYASTVIETIRKYSDNLVLVGTPNWDQDVNAPVGNFLSDGNVAYVLHFYAASHALSGYTAGGSTFQSAANSVRNAGKPIFVSEYGTVSADGDGQHNKSASDTWMSFLNNNKISHCAWHVNNKVEASAFFKPSFTPSASAGWANASNMTSSGQYIYSSLVSWASSAPWRGGSSGQGSGSSSGGIGKYCDFGPATSYGGGCFEMEYEGDCDEEWGWVVDSCNSLYCDWGPVTSYGGGCFPVGSAGDCKASDGGSLVNFCSK